MEEYVNKFNTLSGSTISEHQKNFNIYMQQVKQSGVDVNKLLENLQPQHPQQQVFYARLLIEFGHREKIFSALTSGNKLVVKTVLRKADLKTLFDGVSGKQFVEEVCVKLSPSTRVKLMNKLGKSVDCDDYFQHAIGAYGIEDCKAFLVNCKGGVLRGYIVDSNVRFTDKELITIFREHGVEFLNLYFVNRRTISFSKCRKLAGYLMLQDIDSFIKMLKFGCPRLGRRSLKKLITGKRVDIKDLSLKLEEAKFTDQNLKFKVLYYMLPLEDFLDAYRRSLPEDASRFLEFSSTTLDFLAKIRRAERGRILFEMFKTKYGFDLHPSINYIGTEILELLSLEDRLKFELENRYEHMMSADKSVPLLKGKIAAMNDSSGRIPLLRQLVDTCKINDDLAALKELLKYFNKRHRNEERYLRDTFLFQVLYSFKHERFDEETWKLISDAVDVFTVNKEFFDGIFLFLETEIVNKHNKGEDYSKELKRFLKDTGAYIDWNLLQNHPEIEKACILKAHEFIGELFNKDDQFYAYEAFFSTINNWNKRHSNQIISHLQFPSALKGVLADKNRYCYFQGSVLQKSLQFAPRNDAEAEIYQEIFAEVFKNDLKHITEGLSVWLLKNRPDSLLGYSKTFFDEDGWKPNFLRLVARNYFLKLHGEFVATALEIVANPAENEKKLNGAFLFLSYVPKHFELLESRLYATENPARLKKLLNNLKSNDVPLKNLKIITHYIESKYTAMITGLLNNTLHHVSEETLVEFVSTCENNQVFALVTTLVNSKTSLQILTGVENRTKFLFKCLYRLSSKNQKAWELVLEQLHMQKIPFIPKLSHLPQKRVFPLLNEIFKFELDTETKYALLKQLKPEQIGSDLLDTILKVYAEREAEGTKQDHCELKDFLYNVFLHNPKLLQRLETLSIGLIPEIFKLLCVKSLEETKQKILAVAMLNLLPSTQLNCNYTTSLFTNLTAHYLQNGFENLEQLLIAQLRNSVELYGNGIKFIYKTTVKSFLESLPGKTDGDLWILAEKLVQSARDESVQCLAVDILPQSLPKSEILLEKCNSLVESLDSCGFPIVGIFLDMRSFV